jgi:serine/threonine protein kinase, bacterial
MIFNLFDWLDFSGNKNNDIHYLRVGDVILNRYKIESQISSYRQQLYTDPYLAVDLKSPERNKVILTLLELPTANKKIQREAHSFFKQEAERLISLNDKIDVIPTFIDFFEEDKCFYVVAKYVKSTTIDRELSSHQSSEAEAFILIKDILMSLQTLHCNNIVHQKITPHHIIRQSSNGRLLFTYFGDLKKIREMKAHEKIMGNVFFRRDPYLSPEICTKKAYFSSDIYSLGVIGIKKITGKLLCDIEIDPATGKVLWRDYCHCSDSFASILDKMIERNIKNRYQHICEIMDDLKYI